jgi:hypothetical protein
MRLNSTVRSASASTTVRARRGESCAKDVSWSLVKQTTSQRPTPGAEWNGNSSTIISVVASVVSDGKRFSNTATS